MKKRLSRRKNTLKRKTLKRKRIKKYTRGGWGGLSWTTSKNRWKNKYTLMHHKYTLMHQAWRTELSGSLEIQYKYRMALEWLKKKVVPSHGGEVGQAYDEFDDFLKQSSQVRSMKVFIHASMSQADNYPTIKPIINM